eukprot:8782545-Alexandrium_andersonii.AAC.1
MAHVRDAGGEEDLVNDFAARASHLEVTQAMIADRELETAQRLGPAVSDIAQVRAATRVELNDQAGCLGSSNNDDAGPPQPEC